MMVRKKMQKVIPATRIGRVIVGCLLVVGGMLGFLPVLGFWMIPLGLVVLSVDFPVVRRWRRRVEVRLGRKWQAWQEKNKR